MLSFSSYGSAKHDRVTMVADAVKIAKRSTQISLLMVSFS